MMNLQAMSDNSFFSGGLLLMLFGGAAVWLRSIPARVWAFVERFVMVKIEILDDDQAYQWMQLWLTTKLKGTLSVSVMTRIDETADPEQSRKLPSIYLVPAVGTYFLRYKGRRMTIHRNRQEKSQSLLSNDSRSLRPKESFDVHIMTRNRDLARQLIEECRALANPPTDVVDIYTAQYGCWYRGTSIKPRSLDSVILDGNQAESLLRDITKFQGARDWYQSVGVPWRRGYLLEGPPGNGKTSLIKALAGKLHLNVYIMMLNDSTMNDSRFLESMRDVAPNSIILLEDIDCVFHQREKATEGETKGLTFSGLLNGLDGLATPEGRIVFMTTNHVERLDPALIRPGRCDLRLKIGNATREQARQMFDRFFPGESEAGNRFAQGIETGVHSMATIQNLLMLHRDNPEFAADAALALRNQDCRSLAMPLRQEPVAAIGHGDVAV